MKCHAVLLVLLSSLWACTPTVQVAAPKEPIEINMNVKIEHNIRVQVDRELEDMFDKDSELF
jgi:Skp family chaperone for outer membrane proteins